MTDYIIPENVRTRWRVNARRRSKSALRDLFELRDIITENRRLCVQIKQEAAEFMERTVDSIERSLWIIREYPEADVYRWVNSGFSFHHIESANKLAELSQYDSPAALIEAAIECGNGEGEPMTVPQFENFALGHLPGKERRLRTNQIFDTLLKLSAKAMKIFGLKDDRYSEFKVELSDLWKKYFVESE